MRTTPSPCNFVAPLSSSTQNQLAMYAVAAGAAGVATLALSTTAQAKIIYKSAHIKIQPGGHYALDLNRDGNPDFDFTNHSFATDFIAYGSQFVAGVDANRVVISQGCAAALPGGKKVGPGAAFGGAGADYEMARINSTNFKHQFMTTGSCPWANQKAAYLGVKFLINGKAHYGWIRAKITWVQFTGVSAAITGYAYETSVNKAIVTGKKQSTGVELGSLGALAVGASVLPLGSKRNLP